MPVATKFTPENRAEILERTALGLTQADIARELDIRLPTLKKWIARGRREDTGAYADFSRAYEAAREEAKARPEPMDEAELLIVVSEAARRGSVQAMKLRWEMICADREDEADAEPLEDSFAPIDELAERRAA